METGSCEELCKSLSIFLLPLSSLFFFYFLPVSQPYVHNRMLHKVTARKLETSTSLFENKIPRIIGIRAVGIVLIGLNSKLMDNGNG